MVRATAAFSVIFLPKEEAFLILLPLLSDKDEFVRREAANALGEVRSPGAVLPLIQVFRKDKIIEVRNAAVVALGEIGDVRAVDVLITVLRRKPKPEDEFLRRSAARSIGQIAQIIQTGKAKTSTPDNFLPDKYNFIAKPQFPRLIEKFPVFQTANDALIGILQNPKEADDTKREAAFALGAIADSASLPVLRSNLNSDDYYLAQISQESIQKIQAYQSYQ